MEVHEFFSNRGFAFLGEGFSHYTYENKSCVYKFAKDPKSNVNTKKAYDIEIEVMKILSNSGYPAIEIEDLFSPGCLHPDLWVLKESRANGISYSQETIPIEAEISMFRLFDMVQSIHSKWFMNHSIISPVREKSWKQFLFSQYAYSAKIIREYSPIDTCFISSLLDCAIDYRGDPCFLIMDSNVENFFFNNNNQLSAIIDIDHPLFGDPIYQLVSIRWYRGDRFDSYVNPRISECSEEKYNLYLYFVAVEDMAFRLLHHLPVVDVTYDYTEIRDRTIRKFKKR